MSPEPIISIQRRLAEAGRIRMGEKGPKGEPKRLTHWRLTSPDAGLIDQAAGLYGGKPEPWDSPTGLQSQLTTETAELPVLVLVNYSLRQSYEQRTSPTLVERRCDGVEMDDGKPCLCAAEDDDKCDLITRLTVALPELTTLLGWRLESKGENAARELLGSLELVQGVAQGRPFVPAKLRIVERRGNVGGQPVRYVVPVLDCQVSYAALAGGERPALEVGNGSDYKPIPPRLLQAVGIGDALAATEAQTPGASRTAPIPAGGDDLFGDEPVPVPVDTPGGDIPIAQDAEVATSDQQKLLMATAREHGWADAARYDLTENICGEGIRSVKKVPKDKVDELLAALERGTLAGEPTDDELVGKLRAYGDALSIRQQVDAAIDQHPDDREWLERQVARLKERYEQAQGAA